MDQSEVILGQNVYFYGKAIETQLFNYHYCFACELVIKLVTLFQNQAIFLFFYLIQVS